MKEQTIRFVGAGEENAAELARLRQRMWATTYRGIYPNEAIDNYDYALHEARDLARLRDPAFRMYFMKDGEESVGYFGLRSGESLYLQSLYLLPEYRRRGLGRAVFDFVRSCAAMQGRSCFVCNCNSHNVPALAFYRAMGGEIYAEDLGHENPQEDQISFRFSIRP